MIKSLSAEIDRLARSAQNNPVAVKLKKAA
jgi:hypothetical protein